MINKSKILRILSLSVALAGFVLVSGYFTQVNAQRDPFLKPAFARTKDPSKGTGQAGKSGKSGVSPVLTVGAPPIEQRIEYYKRMREAAAANGAPLPKVTSVLTLNEMSVTGIFRTPRGYAAIVEATPIKLSYTIFPGEKFFDGQLVAVEENALVFRRVTKTSNGKYVASVENKSLRQYTAKEVVQGTAPTQGAAPTETVNAAQADNKAAPAPIVSPLDEMNKQVTGEPDKEKSKKNAKKAVKVAKNKRQ